MVTLLSCWGGGGVRSFQGQGLLGAGILRGMFGRLIGGAISLIGGASLPAGPPVRGGLSWCGRVSLVFVLSLVLGVSVSRLLFSIAWAQSAPAASGQQVAERLQRSIDNPAAEDNVFHLGDAVPSTDQLKSNMRKLYGKLLVSVSGGEVDKAYNPHLRDAMFDGGNRRTMADMRAKAGAVSMTVLPVPSVGVIRAPFCLSCTNGLGTHETACNLCTLFRCPGEGWSDDHIHFACCPFPAAVNTSVYQRFTEDSNFKACCVRKDQVIDSEELIACKSKNPLFNPAHAFNPVRGDGWAGLTEVDFFMTAAGLESARGTTMLATKDEVTQCIEKTDAIMEGPKAQEWIAQAITRNAEWADKAGGGGAGAPVPGGGVGDVLANVREDIAKVRPSGENKKLRFSDAVGADVFTVRPNAATMDRQEREQLARHHCFRREQYLKLMNPLYDSLQLGGGRDWQDLMEVGKPEKKMLWANYCPNGATLMTDANLSNIKNLHRTATDFEKGMQAWREDPLYCQRIQATQNPNLRALGFEEVLEASQGGRPIKSAQAVGYTCLERGKLATGGVPLTFNRNKDVEWRTKFNKLLYFLIAGSLARQPAMSLGGIPPKSYLKGFEPRPYSFVGPEPPDFANQTFIGKAFKGGGINELGEVCDAVSGNDYQWRNRSDQVYVSDYTHDSFTQEILLEVGSPDNNNTDPTRKLKGTNLYVQEWAKDDFESQNKIAKREIDKGGRNLSAESADRKVLNYISTSRIVAVCPEGYTRWRPIPDAGNINLNKNLDLLCREENFGSPRLHLAP
jgi:hypothetical protein